MIHFEPVVLTGLAEYFSAKSWFVAWCVLLSTDEENFLRALSQKINFRTRNCLDKLNSQTVFLSIKIPSFFWHSLGQLWSSYQGSFLRSINYSQKLRIHIRGGKQLFMTSLVVNDKILLLKRGTALLLEDLCCHPVCPYLECVWIRNKHTTMNKERKVACVISWLVKIYVNGAGMWRDICWRYFHGSRPIRSHCHVVFRLVLTSGSCTSWIDSSTHLGTENSLFRKRIWLVCYWLSFEIFLFCFFNFNSLNRRTSGGTSFTTGCICLRQFRNKSILTTRKRCTSN